MELFYASPENIVSNLLTLDSFESNHIKNTLRKREGELIDVTDGCGNHYSGTILSLKPLVSVSLLSKSYFEPDPVRFHLGVGFIKPNRLEFILEKGTEIGINNFYFFKSEHANYFSDNILRFEKITRQAIKQSNRFYLPQIQVFKNFDDFIKSTMDNTNKIAAIDSSYPGLKSVITSDESNFLFCAGPEGGFSETEIQKLKENHFKPVSLGRHRLRAETAAIAGIAGIQCIIS
ncbi:MAG: 16S rRNA (uracil(1498)-N(3))-methyltransferase [Calditrichae bacterium]|nr:16S rRNA (uracil(1498)-N(3))-methyltransferase [Calditrichota bacterium]MCB9057327.1 16S rRNA (uracil(1498)-N(3))-methyltransferase [Calditrichia bacterium]